MIIYNQNAAPGRTAEQWRPIQIGPVSLVTWMLIEGTSFEQLYLRLHQFVAACSEWAYVRVVSKNQMYRAVCVTYEETVFGEIDADGHAAGNARIVFDLVSSKHTARLSVKGHAVAQVLARPGAIYAWIPNALVIVYY